MPPSPRDIDYSVYLVTDSTPAVLGAGRSVVDVVAAALRDAPGAVGVVQLREKQADARAMLATLAALHAHTAAAGVPLLVNDRVDVAAAAMAAGHCEGVHLGQDDLDVATARRLLGAVAGAAGAAGAPPAIVGVTASTPAEAVAACRAGADYLGLGTVFATATKTNTKHVVGPAGIQRMLQAVAAAGFGHVPAVCIGGLHAGNARRVVFQSASVRAPEAEAVRGVAVVSAIMGAADPGAAAAALAEQVRLGRTAGPTAFFCRPPAATSALPTTATVGRILAAVRSATPLSHNMTNLVVQNFAANVALAVGASPIMSNSGAEAADLARVPGSALVVNMGTVNDQSLDAFAQAIAAYNAAGRPVIFDPVGAGATDVRRRAVRTILQAGYIDVIKGNDAELRTVYQVLSGDDDDDDATRQHGVDGYGDITEDDARKLVRGVALRARCVVVLTGATDYVCDSSGSRVVALACGHPIMARVTGTGCALGTVLSATVATAGWLAKRAGDGDVEPADDNNGPDAFDAAVAAVALYGRAAELAAADTARVQGPGSFVPAFLDQLALCRQRAVDGDLQWLQRLGRESA